MDNFENPLNSNSIDSSNQGSAITSASTSSASQASFFIQQNQPQKFIESTEDNPNLNNVSYFPLKDVTTSLYTTSPAITPDEPSKLQKLRTYASTQIKSTLSEIYKNPPTLKSMFDEMDKHPLIYYSEISLSLIGATMSTSTATTYLLASGVRLGTTTLANHLVNTYGNKADMYAKFIHTIGKTIFGLCVGAIIYTASKEALIPIVASIGLPVIANSLAVGITASIISNVALIIFDKSITAVENKILDKENLEKSLGHKAISTHERVNETIKKQTFKGLVTKTIINPMFGAGPLAATCSKVAAEHLYSWIVKGKMLPLTVESLTKSMIIYISSIETNAIKEMLPEVSDSLLFPTFKFALKEANTLVIKSSVEYTPKAASAIKKLVKQKADSSLPIEINQTLNISP